MAIKVLLVGLNYIYEGEEVKLYGSINSVVYFHQRLLSLGYKSSELSILVDIVDRQQIVNILERMTEESQKGDQLIFFFCGHTIMNSSSDILIDLGDDPRGEPRGQIHGTDLNNISAKLPKFVTFLPIVDSCDSGGILKVPKQYRPPGSIVENIYRCIVLTAVDSDDGTAYERANKKLNVWISDFTYCLCRVLDNVEAEGNGMVTYFNLVDLIDRRLKRREIIRLKKKEEKDEQHPGLQCSLDESQEKFLSL